MPLISHMFSVFDDVIVNTVPSLHTDKRSSFDKYRSTEYKTFSRRLYKHATIVLILHTPVPSGAKFARSTNDQKDIVFERRRIRLTDYSCLAIG